MPKPAQINQPNSGIPNSVITRRIGNLEVQISAEAIVKTEITEEESKEELKIQKDIQQLAKTIVLLAKQIDS